MLKALTPEAGHHKLMLLALLAGMSVAILGIFHGSDLLGLAALVTAVTAPIAGFAAFNNGYKKNNNGNNNPPPDSQRKDG